MVVVGDSFVDDCSLIRGAVDEALVLEEPVAVVDPGSAVVEVVELASAAVVNGDSVNDN